MDPIPENFEVTDMALVDEYTNRQREIYSIRFDILHKIKYTKQKIKLTEVTIKYLSTDTEKNNKALVKYEARLITLQNYLHDLEAWLDNNKKSEKQLKEQYLKFIENIKENEFYTESMKNDVKQNIVDDSYVILEDETDKTKTCPSCILLDGKKKRKSRSKRKLKSKRRKSKRRI